VPGIVSMNFHIGVVAHTIPDSLRVAVPAVVVITVNQSVLVDNGLDQGQPSIAMSTCNILNAVFFHHLNRCRMGLNLRSARGAQHLAWS
jgi:hypothetical protein